MSENVNRWAGFSDEELSTIRSAISRAALSETDPLSNEISEVQLQRDAERASYRGPGRYRHHSGDVYEVLGKTFAGAEYEKVILRLSTTDEPGQLLAEMLADFEDTISGQRRYTYLSPLEDAQTSVPAEIKVVDADWGWAVLEDIDGHHHRLAVGDSITVPTLVFS